MNAPESETVWNRGGIWVCTQFPLGGLAMLAARVGPKLPKCVTGAARMLGLALLGAGGLLFLAGLTGLGKNLTPFPKPRSDGQLVQSGAYALARHPIYGGGIIAMLGWALMNGRWAGLVAALLLGVFFDAKANREERWLTEAFTEYAGYRQRVRKLIPWLY